MDRNLCLPSGACSGLCDQGRLCKRSQEASALALGLHRLVQVDGGERVDYEGSAFVCGDWQPWHPIAPEVYENRQKWPREGYRVRKRKSHFVDYLMAALVVFFVLGLAAVSVFN